MFKYNQLQRVCPNFPLSRHDPLTPSWRRTLERRLEKGQVEDWGPRLEGAPGQAETPRPT
ncbi:TPA: 3-alpha domain-containing protein [Pseudomonas aeruginosa]